MTLVGCQGLRRAEDRERGHAGLVVSAPSTTPAAPTPEAGWWNRVPRPVLPPLPKLTLPEDLGRSIEKLVRRDETDVVLVLGNIVLVAFEVVEWPVAALTLAVHFLARTRFKALEALGEVAEETE